MVLRLLFIRHGESEWNALGRWQGQANPPLTARGRAQAQAAGDAVRQITGHGDVPVAGIVTSTLQRALDTASILSDELGVAPLYLDADLVERDAGEWSGLTRHEIEARYPGYLASGERPAGYEGDASILSRSGRAIERIVERFGSGTVLVVSHGGIIYALEQSLGAGFSRKPNLGARWFVHDGARLTMGDFIALLENATVPDLL